MCLWTISEQSDDRWLHMWRNRAAMRLRWIQRSAGTYPCGCRNCAGPQGRAWGWCLPHPKGIHKPIRQPDPGRLRRNVPAESVLLLLAAVQPGAVCRRHRLCRVCRRLSSPAENPVPVFFRPHPKHPYQIDAPKGWLLRFLCSDFLKPLRAGPRVSSLPSRC